MMDHVKTFFKTLLWTVVGIIVVGGLFLGYLKFFNDDLAQKVANFVYKMDAVECPVCQECDTCEIPEDYCDDAAECDCEECDAMVVSDDEVQIEEDSDTVSDELIQDKLDEILRILRNADLNSSDAVETEEPKTQEEMMQEILDRLDMLEKN